LENLLGNITIENKNKSREKHPISKNSTKIIKKPHQMFIFKNPNLDKPLHPNP